MSLSLSLDNLCTEAEGGVLYGHKYSRNRCYSVSLGERNDSMEVECPKTTRIGVKTAGSSGMDDRDKRIYNSLGDTSGAKGKVRGLFYKYALCTCLELELSCIHPRCDLLLSVRLSLLTT